MSASRKKAFSIIRESDLNNTEKGRFFSLISRRKEVAEAVCGFQHPPMEFLRSYLSAESPPPPPPPPPLLQPSPTTVSEPQLAQIGELVNVVSALVNLSTKSINASSIPSGWYDSVFRMNTGTIEWDRTTTEVMSNSIIEHLRNYILEVQSSINSLAHEERKLQEISKSLWNKITPHLFGDDIKLEKNNPKISNTSFERVMDSQTGWERKYSVTGVPNGSWSWENNEFWVWELKCWKESTGQPITSSILNKNCCQLATYMREVLEKILGCSGPLPTCFVGVLTSGISWVFMFAMIDENFPHSVDHLKWFHTKPARFECDLPDEMKLKSVADLVAFAALSAKIVLEAFKRNSVKKIDSINLNDKRKGDDDEFDNKSDDKDGSDFDEIGSENNEANARIRRSGSKRNRSGLGIGYRKETRRKRAPLKVATLSEENIRKFEIEQISSQFKGNSVLGELIYRLRNEMPVVLMTVEEFGEYCADNFL